MTNSWAANVSPAYRVLLAFFDEDPHQSGLCTCEVRRTPMLYGRVGQYGDYITHRGAGVYSTTFIPDSVMENAEIDPYWTFLWRCHPPMPLDLTLDDR